MTNANAAPNPRSSNFFSHLADQMIAKLDIKTCQRIIAVRQQEVQANKKKLMELQAASPKNEADIGACQENVSALNEVIQALRQYQDRLNVYLQDQDRNRQDFVTRLTQALDQNKGIAKQVRHATVLWPRAMFISNKALAEELSVRLQAEPVDKPDHLKKTLSEHFPKDSDVSKALDTYVMGRSELKRKLAADTEAELRRGLGFAVRIWKGMQWPLPFGLVLYEELTELDGLRTKRREEARKCLDALLSHDDEEAREARKHLHSELSQFLVDDAKSGNLGNIATAQARENALQALEDYNKNARDDTKRALDYNKDVLIEMAIEHTFKKLQPNDDSPSAAAAKGELVGLALSGGGIRSATFNLGVLQGLTQAGRLPFFDYLSTVSGGGYIGSWLLAWLKRKGLGNVSKQLKPDWKEHGSEEPPEIEFLRSYSNYLTPQLGLLSADTWSLVATWVRNLLLNLTILVLVISALLLFPRLMVSLSHRGHPSRYLLLTVVSMALAIFCTGVNLDLFSRRHKEYPRYSKQGVIQWTIVIPSVLASWLGSCWLWNEGRKLVSYPRAWVIWMLLGAALTFIVWIVAWLSSLNWIAAWLSSLKKKLKKNQVEDSNQSTETVQPLVWYPLVFSSLLEGAVGGLLFFGLACLYSRWCKAEYPGNSVHFVAWGTGLVAGVFGIMVAIHIGLMGKSFPDERREWWSRVSAWVTIYTLGWMALFAVALYGPLVVQRTGEWVKGALTLGWLAHTIYGALGARSAKTGGSGPNNGTGILIKAAPPVFAIGLLALLSFSIYRVLPHDNPSAQQETVTVKVNLDLSQDSTGKPPTVSASVNSAPVKGSPSYHDLAVAYWPRVWCGPDGYSSSPCPHGLGPISPWWILALIALCAGAAALLSWRVDINEFSMHLLYRNRLVRCYLGASHPAEGQPAAKQGRGAAEDARNPNPFTGFDSADDILLAKLAQGAPLEDDERKYVGPYPILNATLNVTHGKRLAWQERKAQSFVFTPRYCGYDAKPDRQPRVEGKKKPLEKAGYRPTRDYLYSEKSCRGGPYLGTAMGISGAAVSPNMGYHSSSALAFLMTVFNVRLGWWAGNPRHQGGWWTGNPRYKPSWRTTDPPWKRRGPGLGILYLLLELFGSTDDERGYVYLSDGGHFENLGIYELVRRRCKLILACDASEDREYKFKDLGNAIRKCRDDFGVDIEINVDNLRAKSKSGQSGDDGPKKSDQHCAVGMISYDKVWANAKPGILIYIKASLTGDEPTDVLEYKNSHTDFPHDSTADQWFSESQFESYRKLGQHIIEQCASVEHEWRQTMPVLKLLEMDEWGDKRTTGELKGYLAEKLGGVYQPLKATNRADGV